MDWYLNLFLEHTYNGHMSVDSFPNIRCSALDVMDSIFFVTVYFYLSYLRKFAIKCSKL